MDLSFKTTEEDQQGTFVPVGVRTRQQIPRLLRLRCLCRPPRSWYLRACISVFCPVLSDEFIFWFPRAGDVAKLKNFVAPDRVNGDPLPNRKTWLLSFRFYEARFF